MSTVGDPGADVELARRRRRQRRRRRRQRESVAGASETTTTDGSRYFSDSSDDYQSWQSTSGSVAGGSLDECRFPEIERATASRRQQKVGRETLIASEEDDVDLEMGELEMKVHSAKQKREERECRICHLRLVGDVDDDQERGVAIELGCCCKGDLGASHKQCAETWFKIRGNTVCEICGAIAVNVLSEQQPNEPNTTVAASAQTAVVEAPTGMESQTFWHGRRVMNALLTCMVLAFVISWLFHYNMRSKN